MHKMHKVTLSQLAKLKLDPKRPLVICDVDEVIVHFTRSYEEFLNLHGYWLDVDDLSHHFAPAKRQGSEQSLSFKETEELVTQYFVEHTRDMQDIAGAVVSLQKIAQVASIVMLTNLPHESGDDRRHNLSNFGLTFPVLTNTGPKGPAIRRLAAMVAAPVIFIDDSPGFIASAFEHAPHVHLIHFIQDPRFGKRSKPLDYVSLRTDSWTHALPHILKLIQPDNELIPPGDRI